ncbi:hypothetical protein CK203_099910 [Vitis vinifera]|uniref:Disease resistance protein At4g27190-like leucine-rich repeats domain-containing protein n=1 Tax=Vitis vinifera TaxID=29760 RepID=A0A438CEP7_VITVI|nr:hypothetical protein CK203_099910 [Vitis vinifera]
MSMENSFTGWEVEGSNDKKTNASLAELKYLSHLVTLDIEVPDAKLLPKGILFENLIRFKILIGDVWSWCENCETIESLKLNKLNTSLHSMDGISKLLKRAKDLYLRELSGANHWNKFQFPALESLYLTMLINLSKALPSIYVSMKELRSTQVKSKGICLEGEPGTHILLSSKQEIWHCQIPSESFGNLHSLHVESCASLLKFLPSFLLSSLQNLEVVILKNCDLLEEVFDLEDPRDNLCFQNLKWLNVDNCGNLRNLFLPSMASDPVPHGGVEVMAIGNIVFPQLTHLSLESLPNLTSVYPGCHSLQQLDHGNLDVPFGVLFNENIPWRSWALLRWVLHSSIKRNLIGWHGTFAIIHSGQISLAISQSTISLSGLSHSGHQSLFSEPREKTLSVGRIVVRKHSPANFPANFPATVFSTPQGAPGGDLQFSQSTGTKTIHARFSGRRLHLTRRRVRAREPLSGDALPPPGSPDADQPPFLPVFAIRALHVPLLGFFCFRGPRSVFPASSGYFFSTPIPARALGSVLLPFRSMTKYGMASSQVSSVTSPESGGRSEIPNLGGNDSSPILITGHKLNGHNYLQWSQSVLLFICGKGKDEYLTRAACQKLQNRVSGSGRLKTA